MSDRKANLKVSNSFRQKPSLNASSSSKKNNSNHPNLVKENSSSALGLQQLKKELEDPNNDHLKDSIQSIVKLNYDLNEMSRSYDLIKSAKASEESQIKSLPKQMSFNTSYEYTPYLKGLSDIVTPFLSSAKPIRKSKTMTNTASINTSTLTVGTSKETIDRLEALYQVLGHDSYSSLLCLYEKYCEYGKTITNFNLDYSQFCIMLSKNQLYLPQLPKEKCEVIYNRVKQVNKVITFESFVDILSEMCKEVLEKEDNWFSRLKFFYSAYISKAPSLKKPMLTKELDRFYFMLESDDISAAVSKLVSSLYSEYLLNVIGDLRFGEVMDSIGLIVLCKRKQVIPVFMSGKEVMEILNFVKYKRKKLLPSNHFNFLVFCEVICLIALYSYGKYFRDEARKCTNHDNKTYSSKSEQIELFIKLILGRE